MREPHRSQTIRPLALAHIAISSESLVLRPNGVDRRAPDLGSCRRREERDVLAILIVGCGLLGLAIGSFLNVVIYRVPRDESIVTPRSHCPTCATPIKEYDNIPVLSWIVLRGKCRHCHAPISPRYIVVELATGALFAGLAARMGYAWALPAFLIFLAALLALSSIDLELLILPKKIVYPSLVLVTLLLVLASGATHDWTRLGVGAICAAAWFVFFFAMNYASPRVLGFGDVRLAPLLGLALGWLGWRYVVLGFFARQLDRTGDRTWVNRDETDEARSADSLWNIPRRGRGLRDLRGTRDPPALREYSLTSRRSPSAGPRCPRPHQQGFVWRTW